MKKSKHLSFVLLLFLLPLLCAACSEDNSPTGSDDKSSSSASLSSVVLSSEESSSTGTSSHNGSSQNKSSAGTGSSTGTESSSSAVKGDFDTSINPYAGVYRTSFEPGGDCSDDFEFENITIETQKYTAVHSVDGCQDYTIVANMNYVNLGGSKLVLSNGTVSYNKCSSKSDRTFSDSTLDVFQLTEKGYFYNSDVGFSTIVCRK